MGISALKKISEPTFCLGFVYLVLVLMVVGCCYIYVYFFLSVFSVCPSLSISLVDWYRTVCENHDDKSEEKDLTPDPGEKKLWLSLCFKGIIEKISFSYLFLIKSTSSSPLLIWCWKRIGHQNKKIIKQ